MSIKTKSVTCDVHGPYDAMILELGEREFDQPCPACVEDTRKREEQEAQQAADAIRRARGKEALEKAGIPERFAQAELGNYEAALPEQVKVLRNCQFYAEHFTRALRHGICLVLMGPPGTGKTHLACGILRAALLSGDCPSGLYTTSGRLLRDVKSTYSKTSKQTENEALDSYAAPGLLVLDEVGVQHGTETERNIIFEVINARYEAKRPTIVISNLSLRDMEPYLGERALDRLRDNGGMLLECVWPSFRGRKPCSK